MLVLTGGQKRTADAYRALLEATGFELAQVIHTQAERSLIEAVAIDQPK
jgi:hypothetical protein